MLNNLGMVAMYGADYGAARALFSESLARFREIGDRWEAGAIGIAATIRGLLRIASAQKLAGLLPRVKIHRHHIFPRAFRSFFAARGIDIDQFTVELPEGAHLRGVHGKGDLSKGGRYSRAPGAAPRATPRGDPCRAMRPRRR